jgi:hypothetical protein
MNIALHETGSPLEYRNVLGRVRRALRPGGTVVVSELPYPYSPGEYRQAPVYKALAGAQLHEALVGCGMITQGQLRELLVETGFATARVASTRGVEAALGNSRSPRRSSILRGSFAPPIGETGRYARVVAVLKDGRAHQTARTAVDSARHLR